MGFDIRKKFPTQNKDSHWISELFTWLASNYNDALCPTLEKTRTLGFTDGKQCRNIIRWNWCLLDFSGVFSSPMTPRTAHAPEVVTSRPDARKTAPHVAIYVAPVYDWSIRTAQFACRLPSSPSPRIYLSSAFCMPVVIASAASPRLIPPPSARARWRQWRFERPPSAADSCILAPSKIGHDIDVLRP